MQDIEKSSTECSFYSSMETEHRSIRQVFHSRHDLEFSNTPKKPFDNAMI